MIFNPMRRPEFMIRHYVSSHTPIGMSIEDALEVIQNTNRWPSDPVLRPGWTLTDDGQTMLIGEQTVRVGTGNFRPSNIPIMGLLLQTNVTIFWRFNEDGELFEVYVRVNHGVFS